MASMLLLPPNPSISHRHLLFSLHPSLIPTFPLPTSSSSRVRRRRVSISAPSSSRSLQALIFDCDGVILESEHLHHQAYNDAFSHFNVICPSSLPHNCTPDFYDVIQNQIDGGTLKEHGWPSSTISDTPPDSDSDRAKLIDTLQDWKTERYKENIKSGTASNEFAC